MVVAIRRHDKAIVGMNVARFVHGMVARTWTPRRIAASITGWRMVLRTRGKGEVHQMSDGRLSLATGRGSHDGLRRGMSQWTRLAKDITQVIVSDCGHNCRTSATTPRLSCMRRPLLKHLM